MVNETNPNQYRLKGFNENTESFCDTPTRDAHPEANHEKTSDKPKLRDVLENNWPVIFKSVKTMKVKVKHDN